MILLLYGCTAGFFTYVPLRPDHTSLASTLATTAHSLTNINVYVDSLWLPLSHGKPLWHEDMAMLPVLSLPARTLEYLGEIRIVPFFPIEFRGRVIVITCKRDIALSLPFHFA